MQFFEKIFNQIQQNFFHQILIWEFFMKFLLICIYRILIIKYFYEIFFQCFIEFHKILIHQVSHQLIQWNFNFYFLIKFINFIFNTKMMKKFINARWNKKMMKSEDWKLNLNNFKNNSKAMKNHQFHLSQRRT